MGNESINDLMAQYLEADQKTIEEHNILEECSHTKLKLSQEILKAQTSINETRKEICAIKGDISKYAGDYEIQKINYEVWRQTFEKSNNECQTLQSKLDETQKQIWSLRRRYSDEVKIFITNYGIKASMDNNFKQKIRQQIDSALDCIDVKCVDDKKNIKKSEEIIRMECEITKEKEQLEKLQIELEELKKSNEKLIHGSKSAESVSLETALKYSLDESSKCEKEINSLQTHLDSLNSKIIENLFDENNADQTVNKDATLVNYDDYAANNDFRSAKDEYVMKNNDAVIQMSFSQNWANVTNQASTSTRGPSISSSSYKGNSKTTSESVLNKHSNQHPLRNDPYEKIMDIREKNKQSAKTQKGKFNLINNNYSKK